MGYTGLTPGSAWVWRPSEVELGDQWMTLVSEMEAGQEQRRAKWAKPRLQVRMRFERGRLTLDDLADIWRFYRTQQGAYGAFDLPLYTRVTTIASAYSGGTALGLADTQDLTSQSTSRWNRLYVENAAGNSDIFTVTSVVNATRVQVQSASGNAYAVDDPVSPVVKARFAQDLYGPQVLPALLSTFGVEFSEVRS